MRPTLRSGIARTIALCAMSAAVATAQTTARGSTFNMHVKITAVGDGPIAMAMQAQQAEWRGTAVTLGNRGRIDIVEGRQPPVLEQGNFMLFGGTDALSVNPADKTFLLMSGAQLGGQQSALGGLQITLKNVVAKLDTLGPGEAIEGRPTQHFRLTASYEMSMAAMGDAPPIGTTQTTDFWIAQIADIPSNPFSRTSSPAIVKIAGPMAELVDKLAVATAGLPRGGVALRQTTTSRITMSGMTAGTDNITEMSDIKSADVDVDRLVLPSGFTQRTLQGFPPPDSSSNAAIERWRKRP